MNLSPSSSRNAPPCPVCSQGDTRVFFENGPVPLMANRLFDSPGEALEAQSARLNLVFCPHCGMIWNAAFESSPLDYHQGYENSLHFSERFREYAEALAESLIRRYGLKGKKVLEIGAGKGEFLSLMLQRGVHQGIGIDPAGPSGPKPESGERLAFVREYYSQHHGSLAPDFVYSRQLLEHVDNPRAFVLTLRQALRGAESGSEPGVFVEVPSGPSILERGNVWDLIYEHFALYTEPSLVRLFQQAGFVVDETASAYGGQYLHLHAGLPTELSARPIPTVGGAGDSREIEGLQRLAQSFSARAEQQLTWWKEKLREWREADRQVVVWGAGSKGNTFACLTGAAGAIAYLVDLNPEKHERYLPLSALPVRSPDTVQRERPDVVIVANPIYRGEVAAELESRGVSADLLTL